MSIHDAMFPITISEPARAQVAMKLDAFLNCSGVLVLPQSIAMCLDWIKFTGFIEETLLAAPMRIGDK